MDVLIFNQHQSGQPHRHLTTGFAVLMWVEPAGRCPLFGREGHRTFPARLNNPLRSAIDVTGNFQAVPVQRRLFGQLIMDINGDRFTFLQFQRRSQ
ncbi:hypothetical protein D3C73_1287940 [compost metagenome]